MKLPAIAAALLLVGCISSDPTQTSAPERLRDVAAPREDLRVLADCVQFHAYFVARAEDFAAEMPRGFQILSDEAGLTDLRVTPSACGKDGSGTRELWITVPVEPPAQWVNQNFSHAWAVEAYVDNASLASWYRTQGASLVLACACKHAEQSGGDALADEFTVDANGKEYTFHALLKRGSGAFPRERSMVYVQNGTQLTRLTFEYDNSTNRGVGEAILAFRGAGGAPPASPSRIVHAVQGLSYTVGAEPLGEI